MIYQKERDSLRREWVSKLMQRLHARDATEYELEWFGWTTWNESFDQAVEWALAHHPEVKEMDKIIEDQENMIRLLERDK